MEARIARHPFIAPGRDIATRYRDVSFSDAHSLFIASYISAFLLLGFIISSDEFLHWFVVPVLVCGAIIGQDAIDWMRGRLSLLDPAGCLGLLGFHVFFVAPLLHVSWDSWMPYITPPPDWRPWLGGMAILNSLGLLVYRHTRGPVDLPKPAVPRQPIWRIAPDRFVPIVAMALLITALLQLAVYQQFGGIMGYMSTFTDSWKSGSADTAFKGMGALFIVSESFPLLAMMAFSVYASRHTAARSWGVLLAALVVYFVLLMLFGGLRGSRSNTLYSLFLGVGMLHLLVRPISKKMLAGGLLFFLAFMYVYGFYKDYGIDALAALDTPTSQTEGKSRRTFQGVLLGDLARSDVQAFVLYRLWSFPAFYDYAWGRTYLGTAALLIPSSLWPDREMTKVKEGTEAMFGRGSHRPGTWEVSNVYGLAGETMLNFGPFAVPLAFLALGWAVKQVRLFSVSMEQHDIRQFIVPFCVIIAVNVLTADSDNLLWMAVKFGLVPFAVMGFGCRRLHLRSAYRGVAP